MTASRGRPVAAVVTALAIIVTLGCGQTVRRTTDDAGVSVRVRTALLNDPVIAAEAIQVQSQAGHVTLTGRVRSEEERQRAIAVARQTSGVVEVEAAGLNVAATP